MRDKVYFISDVHLGSKYHKSSLEVERKLVRFLDTISKEAKAIYFVGDIFDYWFEYRDVAPQGYVRFLGKVAELSDAGVDIHFFAGNHDVWFAHYLSKELGASIHHKSEVIDIMGKRFRISHGDEEMSRLDKKDRFLYKLFRSKICRKLYAAIHPRWTVGFAMSLSLKSRKKGLKKETLGDIPHAYNNEYFDVQKHPLVSITKDIMEKNKDIDIFVFGHIHIMLDMAMREGKRLIVLGDWIRYFSYAVFDGKNIFLDQFIESEDEL